MMQDEHREVRSSSICNSPIVLFEVLLQSIEHTNYILVTGPGITIQPHLEKDDSDQKSSYWSRFLKGLATWCLQNYCIEQRNTNEEFLHFLIEEYLTEKSEQQRCLREVLPRHAQLTDLHLRLARVPFRGYISTTYDTFLETAYEQVNHRPLPKYYASSIQDAVEACRNGRPFILKPYGDIDDPDSLIVGHRWRKGTPIISKQDLLLSLFTVSPILFFGFEDGDPDFKYLRAVVDGYSPFDRVSISYPIVSDEQHKNLESLSLYEVERHENNLRVSSRLDLSETTVSPESDTVIPIYGYVNSDLYGSRSYNAAVTVQEAPAPIELGEVPPIEIYTAYAASDQKYFQEMNDYVFNVLRNFNYRIVCFSNEIARSNRWQTENYLLTANLILLLVSLSFLASNFWKCGQMEEAVARHRRNDAYVIPIIVQPADAWKKTPFGKLDPLPNNGRAISTWGNRQSAYNEIFTELSKKLDNLKFG